MNWIDSIAPDPPAFTISEIRGDSVVIGASKSILTKATRFLVLYCFPNVQAANKNNPAFIRKIYPGTEFFSTLVMPKEWNDCIWAVTAVSENNNESEFGPVRKFTKGDNGRWIQR